MIGEEWETENRWKDHTNWTSENPKFEIIKTFYSPLTNFDIKYFLPFQLFKTKETIKITIIIFGIKKGYTEVSEQILDFTRSQIRAG